jgi:hypothetical protein
MLLSNFLQRVIQSANELWFGMKHAIHSCLFRFGYSENNMHIPRGGMGEYHQGVAGK